MGDYRHVDTGLGWPDGDERPARVARDADAAEDAEAVQDADATQRDERPARVARDADAAEDTEAVQDADAADGGPDAETAEAPSRPVHRQVSTAGAIIGLLLALLGFTMVVQVKSNTTDPTLASARQEDLVRILSDLTAQEQRLNQDITNLEESQRQLSSGVQGREAALEEARKRADGLGILAGTLPAQGTGLTVRFEAGSEPVEAAAILDAVQELRGAGAEAMQISGGAGDVVRIIASTYFTDADGGIAVDGRRLTGPYTITVIGDPTTMRTALNIPGGVVEEVTGDGGNVIVHEPGVVDVAALHAPTSLEHARPVS
jgi:uncharacterized protein YlxW (UPF0749 family)